MEDRLNKIKKYGYWRILIRPLNFEKEKVKTLLECREIIEKSKVSYRGWDFPHLDRVETSNGTDWIESGADFDDIIEYWRFYQSGQFVHYLAIREDYRRKDIESSIGKTEKNDRFFNIETTIYRITEVFEFAYRLLECMILNPNFEISINIIGVKERELFFFQRDRYLSNKYKSVIDKIEFAKEYSENDFIAKKDELTFECIEYVFEKFNFYPSRQIINEIQEKIMK